MSILELSLIFFVAIIVFGPNKLPQLSKDLARLLSTIARMRARLNRYIQEELAIIELENNKKKAQEAEKLYLAEQHDQHSNKNNQPQS